MLTGQTHELQNCYHFIILKQNMICDCPTIDLILIVNE